MGRIKEIGRLLRKFVNFNKSTTPILDMLILIVYGLLIYFIYIIFFTDFYTNSQLSNDAPSIEYNKKEYITEDVYKFYDKEAKNTCYVYRNKNICCVSEDNKDE